MIWKPVHFSVCSLKPQRIKLGFEVLTSVCSSQGNTLSGGVKLNMIFFQFNQIIKWSSQTLGNKMIFPDSRGLIECLQDPSKFRDMENSAGFKKHLVIVRGRICLALFFSSPQTTPFWLVTLDFIYSHWRERDTSTDLFSWHILYVYIRIRWIAPVKL